MHAGNFAIPCATRWKYTACALHFSCCAPDLFVWMSTNSSMHSAYLCVSHCVQCMEKAGIKKVLTGKCDEWESDWGYRSPAWTSVGVIANLPSNHRFIQVNLWQFEDVYIAKTISFRCMSHHVWAFCAASSSCGECIQAYRLCWEVSLIVMF